MRRAYNFEPTETIVYPNNELSKLNELTILFKEWQVAIGKKPEEMVFDGFYPYYFSQEIRILFVGRESRGLTGSNYIEELSYAYQENKVGAQHINTHSFHKRLLCIAYGLNHNLQEWKDIPMASEITTSFGQPNGLSFAFMNISKISNENIHWTSDWELIKRSFTDSTRKKNFIQEEIKILDPHVIISMNLGEMTRVFGDLREFKSDEKVTAFELELNDRTILVLDTFHFSSPTKLDVQDFYEPICESLRAYDMRSKEKQHFDKLSVNLDRLM